MRGRDVLDLIRKKADLSLDVSLEFPFTKASSTKDEAGKTTWRIEGFASTGQTDRHGDVILASAWDESFPKFVADGGIILFNHDPDRPIGKAVGGKLKPEGPWLIAEVYDEQIGRLIDQGVLNSFSIGAVRPRREDIEIKELPDGSYQIIITKIRDLADTSVVSIPANTGARFRIKKEFRADLTKGAGSNLEDNMLLQIIAKMLGLGENATEAQVMERLYELQGRARSAVEIGDVAKALNLQAGANLEDIRKAIASARSLEGYVEKSVHEKTLQERNELLVEKRLAPFLSRIPADSMALAKKLAAQDDQTDFQAFVKSLRELPKQQLTRGSGVAPGDGGDPDDDTDYGDDSPEQEAIDAHWMKVLGIFRDERDPKTGKVQKGSGLQKMRSTAELNAQDIYEHIFKQPVPMTGMDKMFEESRRGNR